MKVVPVILCGGSGSRLWPVSRDAMPKQLLPLVDQQKSLLQQTVLRAAQITAQPAIVVCNQSYQFMVATQLGAIDQEKAQLILEPVGKNTAPAIAIAALQAMQQDPEAMLLILPADHYIDDLSTFTDVQQLAVEYAAQGFLVTFGIPCHKPETAYGYIKADHALQADRVFTVAAFSEKPDITQAKKFLAAGNYYWNSGMFMIKAAVYLAELKKYAADIWQSCQTTFQECTTNQNFTFLPEKTFGQCRADSIDYAIMEHTDKAVVIPFTGGWSDVGSWTLLWDILPHDADGNSLHGDVLALDTHNSLLYADSRLLITLGLKDCMVVETADAVLVAHQEKAQQIKEVVNQLKQHNREEALTHRLVYRPWGSYEVLSMGNTYKVKRIRVIAGASLSLQLHQQRSEHWVVVRGTAEVTRDNEVFLLQQGESTHIPSKAKHRLRNPGVESLEIIEVQCGAYLGEDDITRFEDQYGRIEHPQITPSS